MIEIEGVHRAYGEVKAVDGVSFEVARGEVVGLLGPNGAGKTTLLRMLATLIAPDAGSIRVDGIDVTQDPLAVRARIGYETGDTGLYSRLKPTEFLRYFGTLFGLERTRLETRIEELVESFEITEFADRLCGNLSTGQKHRVSVARALLHDPPVLILDEPTSGLDIVSSQFMLDAMKAAAGQGRAVLFSTHNMSEVELICDRVVVMHRGRLLANAPLTDVLAEAEESVLSHAFLALVRRADDAENAVTSSLSEDATAAPDEVTT